MFRSYDTCGDCRYFNLNKDSDDSMFAGRCINKNVTSKQKDYDTDACELFEKKLKRSKNEDI